jgi:hypothetical protein
MQGTEILFLYICAWRHINTISIFQWLKTLKYYFYISVIQDTETLFLIFRGSRHLNTIFPWLKAMTYYVYISVIRGTSILYLHFRDRRHWNTISIFPWLKKLKYYFLFPWLKVLKIYFYISEPLKKHICENNSRQTRLFFVKWFHYSIGWADTFNARVWNISSEVGKIS